VSPGGAAYPFQQLWSWAVWPDQANAQVRCTFRLRLCRCFDNRFHVLPRADHRCPDGCYAGGAGNCAQDCPPVCAFLYLSAAERVFHLLLPVHHEAGCYLWNLRRKGSHHKRLPHPFPAAPDGVNRNLAGDAGHGGYRVCGCCVPDAKICERAGRRDGRRKIAERNGQH